MKKYFALFLTLFFLNNLFSQEIPSTEEEIKEYILEHLEDYEPIIGIYQFSVYMENYMDGKLIKAKTEYADKSPNQAIIRFGSKLICITGFNYNNIDYSKSIVATSSKDTYILNGDFFNYNSDEILENCEQIYDPKRLSQAYDISIESVIRYNFNVKNCHRYIKVFPTDWDLKQALKKENYEKRSFTTGTGFLISTEGYVVTSYHLVENSKTIIIKGFNGDFSKTISTEVTIFDKNNDLAILKIADSSLKMPISIPYGLKTSSSEIGESIFTLGYPLTASMGDDIKLTDGIISSKSGYQGDITTYQISAPVQPGNSGGPVFDKNGYIIGVVDSKHTGAENVSYAVKVSYLVNLLEMIEKKSQFPVKSSLYGRDLSEQVKNAKNFVYIIEVNY